MKISFKNRMHAIEWIAEHARDEGHFEVLREQLNYNHIYTGAFFLDLSQPAMEIVLLNIRPGN